MREKPFDQSLMTGMLKEFGLKLIICFLIVVSLMQVSPSALGSIHPYPETDSQMMYRSRLSVQDNQGQAWQLILFKRIESGQVKDFKLRLVGFPGQVSLLHPAALSVNDSQGHHWTVDDQTQDDPQLETVLTSVGQYDVLTLMKELDQAERIELTLALEKDADRTLIVPQSMVREWLELKEATG